MRATQQKRIPKANQRRKLSSSRSNIKDRMTGASDNADGLQSSHVTVSRKSSGGGEGGSGPGDSSTPQRLILLRAWGRCHIDIMPAGLSYSDTSTCGTPCSQ